MWLTRVAVNCKGTSGSLQACVWLITDVGIKSVGIDMVNKKSEEGK